MASVTVELCGLSVARSADGAGAAPLPGASSLLGPTRDVKPASVASDTRTESGLRLGLLGGFEFRVDECPVRLPASAQRVVAFLALQARPLRRLFVAGSLWLDVPEERSSASLRS